MNYQSISISNQMTLVNLSWITLMNNKNQQNNKQIYGNQIDKVIDNIDNLSKFHQKLSKSTN